MRNDWSSPTTAGEVARRSGGRSAYNARRKQAARQRRQEIALRLASLDPRALTARGTQARLASELGVSPATISRDVAKVLPFFTFCPLCGSLAEREHLGPLGVERDRLRETAVGALRFIGLDAR